MSDAIWQDVGRKSAGCLMLSGRQVGRKSAGKSAGNRKARRQEIGRQVGRQAGRHFEAKLANIDDSFSFWSVYTVLPECWSGPGRAEGAKALNLLSAVSENLELSVGNSTRPAQAGGGRIEAAERITAAPNRKSGGKSAGNLQDV